MEEKLGIKCLNCRRIKDNIYKVKRQMVDGRTHFSVYA